jgi:hypothetical protein
MFYPICRKITEEKKKNKKSSQKSGDEKKKIVGEITENIKG